MQKTKLVSRKKYVVLVAFLITFVKIYENNSKRFPTVNITINDKIHRNVPKNLDEADRFITTPIVQNMLSNVNEKLGYTEKPLNWTTVKLMYDMCRYDNSWHLNELSPWCAVFTDDQKNIFEYHEDLSCYYEYGYGNPNAIDMGCSAIKSMLYYFIKVANNELNQPKGILIFSHRGMTETLLVCLDTKKDPYTLTAYNYEYVNDRKWKTSDDCPWLAHLTATFYSCDNTEQYVQFIMNEKPLELNYPGCVQGICPWQSVFNKLKPIADNCGLDYS